MGIWSLPVSRYWNDPLENHWCRMMGLSLEKPNDFGLLVLSAEMVRFSSAYNMENDRLRLWHLGLGFQQIVMKRFWIIGELRYDQANPKYLTAELAEIQNWYLMNLGLNCMLTNKVSIRVGFSVGFREEIALFPKEKSHFDLAKESLQLTWQL